MVSHLSHTENSPLVFTVGTMLTVRISLLSTSTKAIIIVVKHFPDIMDMQDSEPEHQEVRSQERTAHEGNIEVLWGSGIMVLAIEFPHARVGHAVRHEKTRSCLLQLHEEAFER